MNIILDTHILLWFLSGDKKLSQKQKSLITDVQNTKYVSIATIWEIALKANNGKLDLAVSLKKFVENLDENNFQMIDIQISHIYHLSKLPFHHNDPFDRIIIAQAIIENYSLITNDAQIKKYKLKVI